MLILAMFVIVSLVGGGGVVMIVQSQNEGGVGSLMNNFRSLMYHTGKTDKLPKTSLLTITVYLPR